VWSTACSTALTSQVLVIVDAEDGVKADSTSFEITVRGGSRDRAHLDVESFRTVLPDGEHTWGSVVALAPQDRDAARLFRVDVTAWSGANASGVQVATTYVVSGYVPGETRVLHILVRDECQGVTCPADQACTAGGCKDPFIGPEDLAPGDAGVDAGPSTDAGGCVPADCDDGDPNTTDSCSAGMCVSTCTAAVCNDPAEITVSPQLSCVRRVGGQVMCWGGNQFGDLGDGTTEERHLPTEVVGLSDAVDIAAGDFHVCALRRSGHVVCWGNNLEGQLGDGTTEERHVPTEVVGLSDAAEIAAGVGYTCARLTSGHVVCWGRNDAGQLGDGTTEERHAPAEVVGLSDAVEIAAGSDHACARRASGQVVCWGANDLGQLGDGTIMRFSSATNVTGLSDAVGISVGYANTCARRASGQVVCWGDNSIGQLGDGTTIGRGVPTAVMGATGSVEISVGSLYTCSIDTAHQLFCWGSNGFGALGDGTTMNRSLPTPVSIPADVIGVAAGDGHTCALRSTTPTPTIMCWGNNVAGQLGDGSLTDRHTPRRVSL